jgi:hypothetical protein
LFLIFFGLPLLAQLMIVPLMTSSAFESDAAQSFAKIMSGVVLAMGLGILVALIQFLWMWTMGVELHKRLPEGVDMNIGLFKFTMILPLLSTIIVLSLVYLFIEGIPNQLQTGEAPDPVGFAKYIAILLPVYLVLIASSIYNYYFCGKALKSVEMNKEAKLGDSVGEMVLLFIPIIGVWFIQPRLNTIFSDDEPRESQFIDQI